MGNWKLDYTLQKDAEEGNVKVRSFSLLFSVMTCKCFHCRVTVFTKYVTAMIRKVWFISIALNGLQGPQMLTFYPTSFPFHRNVA